MLINSLVVYKNVLFLEWKRNVVRVDFFQHRRWCSLVVCAYPERRLKTWPLTWKEIKSAATPWNPKQKEVYTPSIQEINGTSSKGAFWLCIAHLIYTIIMSTQIGEKMARESWRRKFPLPQALSISLPRYPFVSLLVALEQPPHPQPCGCCSYRSCVHHSDSLESSLRKQSALQVYNW
jgi:hypothetical protein